MTTVLAQCSTKQDAEDIAETCRQSKCRNITVISDGIDKWFVVGENPREPMQSVL